MSIGHAGHGKIAGATSVTICFRTASESSRDFGKAEDHRSLIQSHIVRQGNRGPSQKVFLIYFAKLRKCRDSRNREEPTGYLELSRAIRSNLEQSGAISIVAQLSAVERVCHIR